MLTLEDVKLFLRVDGDEEDVLITSLIGSSNSLVEGILRKSIADMGEVPEVVKHAQKYIIATLYENRQGGKGGLDTNDMLDVVRRMLFAHREEKY